MAARRHRHFWHPPCALASLILDGDQKLLFQKPVTTLQALVSITDTGDDHSAMSRDGDLVRLRRNALCCLSGSKIILHRTGHLQSMSKYLRWNQGDVIFCVARILERDGETWHLAIKGSRKFTSKDSAEIFNTYFTEYVTLVQSFWTLEPLSIDHTWTPKRRRSEIMSPALSEADSQNLLTPRTFARTPLQFRDLPSSR